MSPNEKTRDKGVPGNRSASTQRKVCTYFRLIMGSPFVSSAPPRMPKNWLCSAVNSSSVTEAQEREKGKGR